MRPVIFLLLLVSLALAGGCGARPPIEADTAAFFPDGPLVRSYAYSRVSPDGSTLVGTLTLGVAFADGDLAADAVNAAGEAPTRPVEMLVAFVADAKVFTPATARTIDPAFGWPAGSEEYPLDVTDIREHAICRADVPARRHGARGRAADVAVFWSQALFPFLGMPQRPTQFRTLEVSEPATPATAGDALRVRGSFLREGRSLGEHAFTIRARRGLTSVAARLADGTVITLVERPPAAEPAREEVDQGDGDEQGEPPHGRRGRTWFAATSAEGL